ncbi:hypothetical protein ISS07_02090 [Candidatus Woesearchaeota archaeon]|nr:hypothetical protein [Candidatus Woesearchaeota archaeon]
MEIKKPNSMSECLFFTNRSLGEGFAVAWVRRPTCSSCKEGLMGKPLKKDGKPMKKAEFYECPQCKHQLPNEEMESQLKVEIEYQCPHCMKEGFAETEYVRKTFEGVKAFVFECGSCDKKLGITKKMKKTKKGN